MMAMMMMMEKGRSELVEGVGRGWFILRRKLVVWGGVECRPRGTGTEKGKAQNEGNE